MRSPVAAGIVLPAWRVGYPPKPDPPLRDSPERDLASGPIVARRQGAHDWRAMSPASLDRLLALLVAALAATGIASLLAGSPGLAWLFLAHDVLAGALAVTVALKLAHSVPRAARGHRWGRLVVALVLSVAVVASLAAGFAWVAGARPVWVNLGLVDWTLLTLHAWLGLAIVPLVLVHLVRARWRILRPGRDAPRRAAGRLRSRRAVLVGGGLLAASVAFAAVAAGLEQIGGGVRRFTGSRWLPAGSAPIPTTFLGEPAPEIDLARWRLRVGGAVARPLVLDLEELRAIGVRDLAAVLDCTAGWAVDATWRGVPLSAVLDQARPSPAGSRVAVRSVTGWSASLSLEDARRCLLAWSTTSGPLPRANGAPLRLVAPDHRGLEWVKWVDRVEVT
jgi:hypothetical protein